MESDQRAKLCVQQNPEDFREEFQSIQSRILEGGIPSKPSELMDRFRDSWRKASGRALMVIAWLLLDNELKILPVDKALAERLTDTHEEDDQLNPCNVVQSFIWDFISNDIESQRRLEDAVLSYQPETAVKTNDRHQDELWHNQDFTHVKACGNEYTFNKNQGRIIKHLYENKSAHISALSEEIDSSADEFRLRDCFDKGKHPAWKNLVISDPKRKGFYSLEI